MNVKFSGGAGFPSRGTPNGHRVNSVPNFGAIRGRFILVALLAHHLLRAYALVDYTEGAATMNAADGAFEDLN